MTDDPGSFTVVARDIFARTGRWSNRQLRRMGGGVEVGGDWISLEDRVPLHRDWVPLRLGPCAVEARAMLPAIILLDKPDGVVTSRSTTEGAPSVFGLVDPLVKDAVQPIGRLDRDTTGLLVLVGDGRLVQRLAHPKRRVPRTYDVTLVAPSDPESMERLRAGTLQLKDGSSPRPSALEQVAPDRWSVTLSEGKYHEVRRIFAAAGSRVVALRRTSFGPFKLGDLQGAGQRRLDEDEVVAAYAEIGVTLPERILEVREVGSDSAQS